MNVDEYRISAISQSLNTVLTGLVVAGICWLLMEVNGSREKWARIEERLTTIQKELVEWNQNYDNLKKRVDGLERRLYLLEKEAENEG